MSARRRDRSRSPRHEAESGAGAGRARGGRQRSAPDGGSATSQQARSRAQGPKEGSEAKGGGRRRGQPGPNRNRGRKQGRPRDDAAFWGDASQLPVAERGVEITDDPAAVPRSLGHPPLPGHEGIAEHYFTAVYDRAVTTAGALAAAGGLIDPEVLVDELAS
jgi:hypothetical protein